MQKQEWKASVSLPEEPIAKKTTLSALEEGKCKSTEMGQEFSHNGEKAKRGNLSPMVTVLDSQL